MEQSQVDTIVADIENRIFKSGEDTYTGMNYPEVTVRMQRDDPRLATATHQQVYNAIIKWINSRL